MAVVKYISADGAVTEIDVSPGVNLMQAAVNGGVVGIVGECGGSAMCATCHVYVDENDMGKFDAANAPEQEMLECTTSPLKPTSRLSCQLVIKDDCDTITVHLPETQQ
ncbi:MULTISPECIES: 2Fe-2S iron-sulfur cluster-binding protein [unclassified Pusillimonas]|uniref:2Fe-2S iron-sulfur cluster-binding protein n=1 Tax=unclassified Pusillimonas TaxID=2640016 RepID=UPI000B9CF901|nr:MULTISPECIES: 2Fe-2S iron-sulfur cluster-binding protein [unclassified Pusillimonas]OXR49013.1 ferredoxin [Pusillimonas sp. T2]ROT45889.1 ferredoxin [Pusillimonas sp. NJUB218]